LSGSKPVYVGIDIGSVSANTVVLDEHRNLLEEHYTRTKGEPLETSLSILSEIIHKYGKENIKMVAATGSGGKLIAPLIGAAFTNEVIAQAKARGLPSRGQDQIEMGARSSSSSWPRGAGKLRIADFQMNPCARPNGLVP
jgi:activator of 2-hydroxyglutaryl-CoA dehydratase